MANSIIPANLLANVAGIKLTGNSSDALLTLTFANGDSFAMRVGQLDTSTNYVQFHVNGVDKGYVKFDVSRNI